MSMSRNAATSIRLHPARRMPAPLQSAVRNRVLASLPPQEYDRLQSVLEPVNLPLRTYLVEPNQPIAHLYFMEQGIASVVALTPSQRRIEVGLIGREGISGTQLLLGTDRTPHECFVQMSGDALRVAADDLAQVLAESRTLHLHLLRFVQAFTVQVAQTALSNGSYTLEERLARWLLMCHDRADGDVLFTTHEFLSIMLGVRRPGVTEALHILEGAHMIKAERGLVTILDRAKLEQVAGESYGVSEAEYARLIA
jgi:CRP-like cAMP-binding protein